METSLRKKQLRQEMKHVMRMIPDAFERSQFLLQSVLEKGLLQQGKVVSFFVSLEDEVSTRPLVEYCWENGITVVVPEFHQDSDDRFVFRQWSHSDVLSEAHFGIFHPQNSHTFVLQEVGLVFVPGMAFSLDGVRLGRGKGFYDRLLSKYHGRKIGLCFREQIKENIPFDERDVPVDEVITC